MLISNVAMGFHIVQTRFDFKLMTVSFNYDSQSVGNIELN